MREMYTKAGFDDYLTKPIDAERLEMMLLQYLPKDKVNTISAHEGTEDTAATVDTEDTDDYALPEFLYDISELDTEAGIKYCGDAEEYVFTLKAYQSSAEAKAAEIEKYMAAGDIKNTTIKVHALKSSSRAIGAAELGEFAARLEKAGNDGNSDILDKELDELISEYRQLAKKLEPINIRKEWR